MPKPRRSGNQHNNRHENGSVAPGKRIRKHKSVGQLNGNAESSESAADTSTPPIAIDQSDPFIAEWANKDECKPSTNGSCHAPAQANVFKRPVAASRESSDTDSHANGSADAASIETSMDNTKCNVPSKENVMRLPFTILRSCPPADTLTILIILLSIPSTILTVINTLFAMLTFMPPAGSLLSLPLSFSDMFTGFGGTPSVATIIITDLLGILIWSVIWTPIQSLTIEYTQAVVAATLGGGNTNKEIKWNSTIWCLGLVTGRHVLNQDWLPERLSGPEWSAIMSRVPDTLSRPISMLSKSSRHESIIGGPRENWHWFRILIALHILIQGLVHLARRWLQKREYFQIAGAGRKIDPEAGSLTGVRAQAVNHIDHGSTSNHAPVSLNLQRKTSAVALKDIRDKQSGGKKKKRQATLVRSQQPLWAAFAATKVTIMREYEQNQALTELAAPGARNASDLGDADFGASLDTVWIRELLPDSFMLYYTTTDQAATHLDLSADESRTAIESSETFYVCINDALWTSTSIRMEHCGGAKVLWSISVTGLAPCSSYRCALFRSEDDSVVQVMTLTTPSSLTQEPDILYDNSDVPFPASETNTLSSPSTTLQKAISTHEGYINDLLARQRRCRKENKAAALSVKKDVEILHSRISKLAADDKTQQNRHLQLGQQTKQADEATIVIEDEIKALNSIPKEEMDKIKVQKAAWEDMKDRHTAAKERLSQAKANSLREVSAIQNEAMVAQQKKDRLLTRKLKLQDQYERLEAANEQGQTDHERRTSAQAIKDAERLKTEQQLQQQMMHLTQAFQDSRIAYGRHLQQLQELEQALHDQQAMLRTSSPDDRPLTPEGDLPGERPPSTSTGFRFGTFGTPDSSNGLRSHSGSIRQHDNRPRSTSVLSSNSQQTEFEDQTPVPRKPARANEFTQERSMTRSGGGGKVKDNTGGSSQREGST